MISQVQYKYSTESKKILLMCLYEFIILYCTQFCNINFTVFYNIFTVCSIMQFFCIL